MNMNIKINSKLEKKWDYFTFISLIKAHLINVCYKRIFRCKSISYICISLFFLIISYFMFLNIRKYCENITLQN